MKRTRCLVVVMVLLVCALCGGTALAAKGTEESLMTAIDELAQHGWVLNCDFRIRSDSIDDMRDEFGDPDSEDYVKSAKGTYAVYEDRCIVAGYNDADMIFELRSTDHRLRLLTYEDMIDHFGKPDHSTVTKTEKFYSYVLNNEVNLKFVFYNSKTDTALRHYNVIWLAGTSDITSGDYGRKW